MRKHKNYEDPSSVFSEDINENENTKGEGIIQQNDTEENSIKENAVLENAVEENPEKETGNSLYPESTSEEQSSTAYPSEVYNKDTTETETENENDFSALKHKTKQEINMMLDYALHSGKKIPEEITEFIHSNDTSQLIKIHGIICDRLSPATPETIMYTRKFYRNKKSFVLFSPIPLVRNFTIISIAAVLSLVISSLSAEVNTETLSKGVLNNHGFSLLINLVFLCSAALMGASFFLLSKLTKEVKEASLSADDATYYWTMLIMGVLSGMILSEGVSVNTDTISESVETNRLVFAILGGFSSEVVYKILQNIMQKVQSAIASI